MEDLQPKLNSPKKKKKSKKLIPVTDIIDVRTKPHRGLSDNDVTYDESNLIEPKNDKKNINLKDQNIKTIANIMEIRTNDS